MKRRIHPEARDELREALLWYSEIDHSLAIEFRNEVHRQISRILTNPFVFNIRSNGFRRANLEVYPYYIPFFVEDETVHILAFAHSSRRPNYWIHRTSH